MRTATTEDAVAAAAAAEAGRLLLELRRAAAPTASDEVGRRGDAASHRALVELISRLRPGDAIVSEEAKNDARAGADRFWLIDPLDGTREYGEGRSDWAVHVALVDDGRLIAGAVAVPARGLSLSTGEPPPLVVRDDAPIRILVSRSRPPEFAGALADRLDATLIRAGSAGAKTAAVVLGEADAYVHDGGQFEWDSAAPAAVALAAGLHVSRLDGSPLRYGNPGFWLPDLLVARRDRAAELLAAIAAVRSPDHAGTPS
jgi:3'(2'), 5'-bisphosphate nucleotidase